MIKHMIIWTLKEDLSETEKEMECVRKELNGAYSLRSAKNSSKEGTL